MKIVEYEFTGFYPSGNPFLWYYDENKRAMFETSINVQTWDKNPKIGDKIKYEKSGQYNQITEKVWINNLLVYVRSHEKEAEIERITDNIYYNLKKEKNLI